MQQNKTSSDSPKNYWFRGGRSRIQNEGDKNKKRALTCLLLSARSMMNEFDHLEVTVNRCDPDITGITESWCTPSVPDTELQLISYELFRHDRDSENKGGGVLLYVKSKLKPQETTFTSPFKDQVWLKLPICILVFAIVL